MCYDFKRNQKIFSFYIAKSCTEAESCPSQGPIQPFSLIVCQLVTRHQHSRMPNTHVIYESHSSPPQPPGPKSERKHSLLLSSRKYVSYLSSHYEIFLLSLAHPDLFGDKFHPQHFFNNPFMLSSYLSSCCYCLIVPLKQVFSQGYSN